LHEASDGQSNFAPVFKDNKQLDSEADRLDVQRVLLVDSGSNGVGFARELQIVNPMALPFLKENDKFLSSASAWNGEAYDPCGRLEMEETGEP
jgi:hypothetical protein